VPRPSDATPAPAAGCRCPDDLERRGDDDGAGGRQLIQVRQACQAELPRAVHDRVVRERRVERARLAGIGADRLDADAEHVALARQQLRRAPGESRACAGPSS
jgi:hypothetical protein